MSDAAPPDVAGRRLPGGTYRIEESENATFCASVGAKVDPSGLAHPLFYYIATQCAMGVSVAGLLELCEFDVNDGPLMTGSKASFQRPLRVGTEYRVDGAIVSLIRKPSRAFGMADQLQFRLTLSDEDGEAAEAVSSWILPRRGLA
jgi:hypothetical protein